MIILTAKSIYIGPNGKILANGRGYGGGGGCSAQDNNNLEGGKGGKGGIGGKGADGGSAGGGGSNNGPGGASYAGFPGEDGTEDGGGKGGDDGWTIAGGPGGSGFGGGGGGGVEGGGGGGGSGGKDANFTHGGDGAGPFGGKGGKKSSELYLKSENHGENGGYMAPSSNGDTTEDLSIVKGSGGGGGGGSLKAFGGAGGGGGGGGAVSLISEGDITIEGCINTTGGGGGTGGSTNLGCGAYGGGGAGGGVLIMGRRVSISGVIDNRGCQRNTLSTVNGGTVKIFYAELHMDDADIRTGRLYTNGRPTIPGLEAPENNTGAALKPAFRWRPAIDPEGESVTGYHLQVSRDPDFSSIILDMADIKSNNFISTLNLEGSYFYWRVRASDAFGYGLWSEVWRFHTDTTPPESRVLPLSEFINTTSFHVQWTGTDDSTGLVNYTIWVSENGRPFTIWLNSTTLTSAVFNGTDGTNYRFYSTATDFVGNREEPPPEPDTLTTVDTTPPSSTIVGLAPYQNRADFKVEWAGIDNVSGITGYTVFYSEDGRDFIKWLDNVTVLSADFHGRVGVRYTFIVVALDRAGNLESWPGPGRWFSTLVDTEPPHTAFHPGSPSYGRDPVYLSATTRFTLEAMDFHGSVNLTYYRVDERPQLEYSGPVQESIAGHHNLTFWSVDSAGNEEPHNVVWFCIDDRPPTVNITLSGPNLTDGRQVFITQATLIMLDAEDSGSGVARIEYELDGEGYFIFNGNFTISRPGAHVLRYRCVDHVDYQSEVLEQRVFVDASPPATEALLPCNLSRETIKIQLRASDPGSGVCATYFRISKGIRASAPFLTGNELRVEAAGDHSLDGRYIVEFYSTDRLGNTEKTQTLEVTIDTIAHLSLNLKDDIIVHTPRFLLEGSSEPGSMVSVNGRPVPVMPDGRFAYELRLSEGRNRVVVETTDPAGNNLTIVRCVTYSELTFSSALVSMSAILIVAVAVTLLLMLRKKGRGFRPGGKRPE
ncbi:MAG: hypothetical protein QXH42_02560 [Thermoplasmata archaeon]